MGIILQNFNWRVSRNSPFFWVLLIKSDADVAGLQIDGGPDFALLPRSVKTRCNTFSTHEVLLPAGGPRI